MASSAGLARGKKREAVPKIMSRRGRRKGERKRKEKGKRERK